MITVYFNASNQLDVLLDTLSLMAKDAHCRSLLVFCADENHYDIARLDIALRQVTVPLIGGIFPSILHENQAYSTGFVVIALPYTLSVKQIHHLSDNTEDYESQITQAFTDTTEVSTLLVFVDGLAKRIAGLVDGLFANFGTETHYIGGGAGSLSFVQKPCLLCQEGVIMDAALIGALSANSQLAVGHGWQTIVPDLQVTKVDRNVIQEINYCNAFDIYATHVNRHHPNGKLSHENFFSIAQSFPFGINKLDGEKVVRDPIAVTEEGYLVCVGELTQGDFVDLLAGDSAKLIQAAKQTAILALQKDNLENKSATKPHELTLFIDCISRALFLKTEFNDEVETVRQVTGTNIPLVGALVLGEIANSGTGYLEFYNKTSVVSLISDIESK